MYRNDIHIQIHAENAIALYVVFFSFCIVNRTRDREKHFLVTMEGNKLHLIATSRATLIKIIDEQTSRNSDINAGNGDTMKVLCELSQYHFSFVLIWRKRQ